MKNSVVFYSIYAAALLGGCGADVDHFSTEVESTAERSIATVPGASLTLGYSSPTLYVNYLSGTYKTGGDIKNCDLSYYYFELLKNGVSTTAWSGNLIQFPDGSGRCGSTSYVPLSAPISGKYTVKLVHPSLGNYLETSIDISPPPPPLPPRGGPILGWVEGFSGNTLSGWACDKNVAKSIDVHFYLDAPAGGGGIGPLGLVANLPRERAVGLACGTSGIAHGWSVDATPYRAAYAGKRIFVHGISTSGGPNPELNNSGVFTIPR